MFRAFNIKNLKKLAVFLIVIAVATLGAYIGFRTIFPLKYMDLIYIYSFEYNVPAELVCAVIKAESGFDPQAKSRRGASGLMQVMKQTADWAAEEIGLADYDYSKIMEPELNIQIGCWYLGRLIKQYDNNTDTALAAYNAGSGNVAKWMNEQDTADEKMLSSIPFEETDDYIKKVNLYAKVYDFLLQNNN